MTTTNTRVDTLSKASTATTVIDAMMEFMRGRRAGGLFLLGAAALSSRIPGVGTAASLLLRAYRRLR
ncbi:uncharacterized protein Nmag_0669 [Natrialba magadii ATCC 43099]|uniref:Uncharacterized protein n=1 Tax=Natrialba magadii (strain ATCC 43099 / DSM 3394 / CCM 3739 / CIP 104546 / IAM 13178 / JCM 8861 / NBRC 102185 / NCIMB 2190 / MS3) TaxID=547559 RepID=D3SZC0_NATMM|nr:hypothetical protein [Natrialba magadii]ADD04254.1 uncharacterized protein Nmag_0669 [Natrialba magadii ATCC 43099]ELY26657.1 hypothetical protein C500_15890 [Natrialba magadii ATCC 43099]